MEIKSVIIAEIVHSLIEGGSKVEYISSGWENIQQVVHMKRSLSSDERAKIASQPQLRYWVDAATPHNAATEGFTDDLEKVSISFPANVI